MNKFKEEFNRRIDWLINQWNTYYGFDGDNIPNKNWISEMKSIKFEGKANDVSVPSDGHHCHMCSQCKEALVRFIDEEIFPIKLFDSDAEWWELRPYLLKRLEEKSK
jgi:hypothetical protein